MHTCFRFKVPVGHAKLFRWVGAMADPIPVDAKRGEEALAILECLEKMGLTGPMLAVSVGTEAQLTKQLQEHLRLQPREWHLGFVQGQVAAAKQMEDLDFRLQGSASSSTRQMLFDASIVMDKEKAEMLEQKRKEASEPVLVPKRGTLGKSVRLRTGRIVTEDEAEEKVLRTLVNELTYMGAPVLAELESTSQPERAMKALLGKYRASTLRRYLAGWQHYRKWCELVENRVTGAATSFIDYLYVREEEGMGASIPLAVSRSVAWFQQMAGVPEEHRLANNQAVDLVVKDLVKKLESKAMPIKRAPRWLTLMIGPMEEIVMSRKHPVGRRIAAWMKLVKMWAALRFSDAANMRVRTLKYYDGKMTAILQKTKTTGAGKRVRELPVYVGEDAYVAKKEWLGTGLELIKTTWREDGQYVFNVGAFSEGQTGVGPMKYYEASGASCEVIAALEDYEGNKIFPEGYERFWTEHSERSTLPSCLAAMGVGKTDRDLIGRWLPEGSDQYVRTYNAAVARLQRKFVKEVRSGKGYTTFDEGSVLEEIKDWLVTHWEVDRTASERSVEAFKNKAKVLSAMKLQGGKNEGKESDTESLTSLAETDGSWQEVEEQKGEGKRKVTKDLVELGEKKPPKERKYQNLAEERQGGYVVVYQRAGRGTLHQLGPDACWMARKRSFSKAEVFESCPEPENYSTWCKLCWKETAQKEQESTSDSCDDLDLSDITDS